MSLNKKSASTISSLKRRGLKGDALRTAITDTFVTKAGLMSRYDATEYPLCYAGTHVLKNKAGLQSQDDLDQFEQLMFLTRSEEPLPHGDLDYDHYKTDSSSLFQDVYGWAGQSREIRTAKGGSAVGSVVLADPRGTSQRCSGCGAVPDRPKTLADRVHGCGVCGLVLDRDVNAARNVLQQLKGPGTGLRSRSVRVAA